MKTRPAYEFCHIKTSRLSAALMKPAIAFAAAQPVFVCFAGRSTNTCLQLLHAQSSPVTDFEESTAVLIPDLFPAFFPCDFTPTVACFVVFSYSAQ